MSRHSLKIMAIIALALALGAAGASQSATPCATLALSVTPVLASAGDNVTITGSVFNCSAAKERVNILYELTGPCSASEVGTIRLSLKSGETRSTSLSYTVSRSDCPGTYTITVSAYAGGVLLDTKSETLTIQ
jgi:hypothetical protein